MTAPTKTPRPRKGTRGLALRLTATHALYAALIVAALAIAHYTGVTVGMKAAPLAELRERTEMLDSARARVRQLTEEVNRACARSVLDAQARQLGPRR